MCDRIEKNQFPVGILKQFHRRVRMMNDLQHPGIVEVNFNILFHFVFKHQKVKKN